MCRKSIQLAGFHAAKPGAIVPGIGIFTTPSAPLRWPKQPAIITAISVSGIFQPFLISPLRVDRRHLLPLSTSSTTSVTASERAISYEKKKKKNSPKDSSCGSHRCAILRAIIIIGDSPIFARREKNIRRKMVRGLFERELCRDKNKKRSASHTTLKKNLCFSPCL